MQNLTGAVRNPERPKLDDEEKVTEAIRDLERLILKDVVPRLNDNPKSNTPILQQNNTIQLSQTFNDGVDEPAATQQSHGYTFQVPDNPVGLDNPIDEVRQILLRDDVYGKKNVQYPYARFWSNRENAGTLLLNDFVFAMHSYHGKIF